MQYVVMQNASSAIADRAWLLVLSGQTLASFHSHEAACRAAVTLARIDLLSGREADVWLAGCGDSNQRIKVELEPVEAEREGTPEIPRERNRTPEAP